MVRFRWVVIALWILAFLSGLGLAPKVTSALKAGFGEVETESRTALDLMSQRLDIPEASITLVFSSNDLVASDPRYIQEMERAIAPLRSLPEVQRVVTFATDQNPHMVSPDGHTTYALVLLNTDLDTAMDILPQIKERLEPGELQMWATGGVPIFSDLNRASERDLRRAEVIVFPLVLVALIIVFGSIVAAGLPVVVGGFSVAITMALVYLLAQRMDVSIFVLNIASFLGLGMAIDYSLLIVSRFREELLTRDKEDAIGVTMSTAGKAILFSGITSVLGLSGLLLFKFMMLRSLGVGGVIVILMSMLLALTLLPAALGVLGHRVNALSILPRRVTRGRFWHRLAHWVMRHPVAVVIPVMVVLLILGQPFLNVNLGAPWASILPRDAEARIGWEAIEDAIGLGESAPITLVVTSEEGVLQKDNVGELYDFANRLSQDPRVARVDSIVTVDPRITREQYQELYASPSQIPFPQVTKALNELTNADGDTTLLRVISAFPPLSEETKALVEEIRTARPGGGLKTYITGVTADLMDTIDKMYNDFPIVVIYVFVTIYIALFWLFRSVVLPLKAVIMNSMSIFASYGALVFVFQEGYGQGLLGFTAEGFIEPTVPILMFCIIFGLSMDYEVFLLSRIKEEYDATGDNTNSVALGLERTGRVITSAALILVLVSGSFASGDIVVVKALGLGVAVAILIDSTVVRALLVPALMRIMGRLNWWAPAFLKEGPAR